MPSIADQVATMEHDHAAALAEIDTLTSSLAALTAALASTTNENLSLREQNQALNDFANETRATVETLALGTMELLRASRRPVGGVAASKILPFAPKTESIDRATNPIWKNASAAGVPDLGAVLGMERLTPLVMDTAGFRDGDPIDKPLIADEIIHADSGDAQPDPSSDNGSSPETEHGGSTPSEGARPPALTPMPVNEFAVKEFVVREMAGPTLVVHDDHDLPIFLTRDRPFINAADRAIFG